MPLKSPNLDDRTQKDIVEEIRNMIPRYAPEWTDWNEHDPGITLIQLFSWITEIIIYRLDQVPDKNYIEFLKLIGLELKPATPAKAHLTFTVDEDIDSVIVPKGTPIATEPEGDEEPIIFETDEPLIAVNATLKEVHSFDGNSFTSETVANDTNGQSYNPFGENIRVDNAYYLGFSHPVAFPQVDVRMMVEFFNEDLPPEGSHSDKEELQFYPPAELVWEYWNGNWEKLEVIKDETRSFLRSGYIIFRGPSDIVKSSTNLLPVTQDPLFWIRCRVVKAGYEYPPRIDAILLNTVRATNAVSVKDEIIGSSDGSPKQSFSLNNVPVLSGTIVLDVDEGNDWETWEVVDDFHASNRHDQHYSFNRVTGEIEFGDGINGKIPFAGENNIKSSYRYGGGKNGNVGAGTITSIQTSISDVDEVVNKRAAIGGEDEEDLDKAKERGPLELKTRNRAVTTEDFEFLAKQTPGVRVSRARALPLYHPKFPYDVKVPGVVTVIIIPYSKEKKPVPSEGMIRAVCEHLNKHRLLTTEVYVVPPKYMKVRVEAKIVVTAMADAEQVSLDVKNNLNKYYHPLTGGTDGTGWAFGGDIYFSEAYRIVLNTVGVSRIDLLELYLDCKKQNHCDDIRVPDNCLVYSDEHLVDTYYSRGE